MKLPILTGRPPTRAGSELTRRDVLRRLCSVISAALLAESTVLGQRRRKSKKGRKASKRKPEKRKTPRMVGPISGEVLYRDLITYYNLGEHRTATDVDLRTSDWIASQLRAAGFKTAFQRFTLPQFFPRECSLTVSGKKIRSFPLWPVRSTALIRAPLAELRAGSTVGSLRGRIALVKFPFDARATVFNSHADAIATAAAGGAVAVVAVTEGPTGEVIALNSRADGNPYPLPVALVAPRDEPALATAAATGVDVSFLLDGRTVPDATARNVVGRLDRGKDLIVVSTPQSGWFRCAGERGPGIALFLGLARWASKRKSSASFLFVSTSGHEFGGLGMKNFQQDVAPPPERVLCWLHLGAGIATWEWEKTSAGMHRLREADGRRLLMCSADLVPLLTDTFSGLPGLTPVTGRAVGEFEFMMKRGYHAFGIAASHTFHHTPADSPETTSPELLEPVATAIVKSLEAIEAKRTERG